MVDDVDRSPHHDLEGDLNHSPCHDLIGDPYHFPGHNMGASVHCPYHDLVSVLGHPSLGVQHVLDRLVGGVAGRQHGQQVVTTGVHTCTPARVQQNRFSFDETLTPLCT
jgi:hypothetical protein